MLVKRTFCPNESHELDGAMDLRGGSGGGRLESSLQPAFEVATIKISDPTADVRQMIRDPRRVALALSIHNLLAQAYRIQNF
jgi:hypothetical protein